MILAPDRAGRQKALDKLLPMQREDFYRIFKVMEGMPVTIRTLDPPLHEFLVQAEKEIELLAAKIGHTVESIKEKLAELHEANPMLGLRGCRLGIQYPEITIMQATAIFEAAAKAAWTGKVDNYLLCNAQDRAAANFFANAKAEGREVKPAIATPPCADPGPFAYVAPEAKPLEAAGAHSPATTAASPPSGPKTAAELAPAKK